jgi:hypothetical protein
MSINYVIKVMSSYCDTIAIGDISYRYELIGSQLSTNRFLSPRASESALSYTHRVRNGLMIAAIARTLNLTTLNWSQVYSILQLSCFAIFWTESILHHLGHMNRKSHSVDWASISIIGYWLISYMTLHIARCHNGLMLMAPHLP